MLGGVVLARARAGRGRRASGVATGVGLALVAALGFGLFVVGLDAAADDSVAVDDRRRAPRRARLALVRGTRRSAPLRPPARLLPMIVAVGAFDTVANVLVALRDHEGPAGIVAVLSALYPVTTIVLARARPRRAARRRAPASAPRSRSAGAAAVAAG